MPSRVAALKGGSGPLDEVLANARRVQVAGLEGGERVGGSLDEAIEGMVNDVRQWNIEFKTEGAERKLLRELHGVVKKIGRVESTIENDQGECLRAPT
ncbi:hypothetical protein [Streptomyces europaeiscabiei]|uniref:hypothetical protein n=1 Tax=Streptomyces europaeiscabiei TaxID=146819 RepID=UPI0038F615E2